MGRDGERGEEEEEGKEGEEEEEAEAAEAPTLGDATLGRTMYKGLYGSAGAAAALGSVSGLV